MNSKNRLFVALGVLWFVLIDALLRSSSATLNAISVATGAFRGILQSVLFERVFRFEASIILLGCAIWIALVLILLVLRIWSGSIRLTRELAQLVVVDDSQDSQVSVRDILHALVGEKPLVSRNSTVWVLLRDFLLLWLVLLVFQILLSVISVMYSF